MILRNNLLNYFFSEHLCRWSGFVWTQRPLPVDPPLTINRTYI